MARRMNFGAPNINTSVAAGWTDVLSLAMQLHAQEKENKWRTAETEAARQHSESLIYLRDLLQDQNRLDQQGFKLRNEARDVGILETALNKIQDEAKITEGGKNFILPRREKLESEISIQQRDNSIIEKELNLYSLGYNIANTLDTNFDSDLSDDELATYVKKEYEGELPKSIQSGLDNWFLDPARREKVTANEKTEEMLMSLDKLYPGNKHIEAAKKLFFLDPDDARVGAQITKAITTQEDPVDNLKKNLETRDITFRNYMEGLESSRQGVDPEFLKGLSIQGTEDYKAKSLTDPAFVSSFRRDLGSNFATWFSGETREGEDYSSSPIDWIKDTFEAEGGWKDIDNSVTQVMADPRWEELISNPEKLEDAFDWTGLWKNEAEEEAANNFFLKAVELYDTVDTIDRQETSYSPEFLKKLDGTIDEPAVPVDEVIKEEKAVETEVVKSGNYARDFMNGLITESEYRTALAAAKELKPPKDEQVEGMPTGAVQEPIVEEDFFFSSMPTLASERDPDQLKQELATLDYIYKNPDTPAEFKGEVRSALDLLISVATLEEAAYNDPDISPELSSGILDSLDLLDKEKKLDELINMLENSPAIRNEFAQKGQSVPILKILEQWKSDGYPDIGDFILDEFPDVEPEFIR